jgi:hypothetical protein
MLHELGVNDPIQSRRGASSTPRQLPDGTGKSHHGHACSGAGCWLRSTTQNCMPAVRVVTHKTEASVRVSPQSVGMEHPGRGCLTISPQPAHEHPPSHPTVTYRVPPSGHTPHGFGWRDGSSKFGRSGPRYARAPSAAHSCFGMYLVMLQQDLRAVTRKNEATVCVSLRSVGFSAKDHLNSSFSGWHQTQPAAHLTVASARTWR